MAGGPAGRGGYDGEGFRSEGGAPATDRRMARGTRTRELLMSAMIDLIDAGHPTPTAGRVAARADVAVRTIFHHFDGLDDLYCQAVDRHVTRVRSSIAADPPQGPLEVRIAIVVRQRRRLFEAIGPVLQASYARAPAIPALSEVLDGHRWALLQQLARSLAPELDACGPLAPAMLTTAGAVSGWSQWNTLRFEAGHSAPQAERTMVFLVAWVVERLPGHPVDVSRSGVGPDPTRVSD